MVNPRLTLRDTGGILHRHMNGRALRTKHATRNQVPFMSQGCRISHSYRTKLATIGLFLRHEAPKL